MNDPAAFDDIDAVLRYLTAAAALVRSGEAVSVQVAGVGYGEQLLLAAGRIADREGVTVEPIWWSDDVGCDLLVRPVDGQAARHANA